MSDNLRQRLHAALGGTLTLGRELGGGWMSRVFVARDEALGRDVVVEVLAPELAQGLSAERFAREIRFTAAPQKPHIVPHSTYEPLMHSSLRTFRFALLLVALVVPAGIRAQRPAAVPSTQVPSAQLDAYVASVLKTFDVPGVAVAVVRDGKVLLARGYGVRTLGAPTAVDEHTLFGIASNTKAFTATALGLLVEEGKLEWDAPVIRYLPEFAMHDPYVTRELSVRDLLVHRSGLGLGAGDLLTWPPSTYDRKEVVRRLRYIKPATSFRSAYAYDNVLYLVAGEVIERVSGQTWEEFVRTRILDRVGMRESTVRHADAAGNGNAATPHAEVDGRVRPVAPFASDNINPAGGINSNAVDMARWMITQLDSGRTPDGARLFQPALARELWTGVTPMPIGGGTPGLEHLRPNFLLYALGFDVGDYRGRTMLQHTGGLPGYVSEVTMIPDLRLGVAVLTNQESGAAFSSITYHIVDALMGAPRVDYLAAFDGLTKRARDRMAKEEQQGAAARDSLSRPALAPGRYAGTFTDAWYGDVTVAEEQGRLVMRFAHTPALVGDLEHWQYDTFLVRWRDRELRADAFATYRLDAAGMVESIRMIPASPMVDFSYDFQDLDLRPKP